MPPYLRTVHGVLHCVLHCVLECKAAKHKYQDVWCVRVILR